MKFLKKTDARLSSSNDKHLISLFNSLYTVKVKGLNINIISEGKSVSTKCFPVACLYVTLYKAVLTFEFQRAWMKS